jgi:hypothetical protein
MCQCCLEPAVFVYDQMVYATLLPKMKTRCVTENQTKTPAKEVGSPKPAQCATIRIPISFKTTRFPVSIQMRGRTHNPRLATNKEVHEPRGARRPG